MKIGLVADDFDNDDYKDQDSITNLKVKYGLTKVTGDVRITAAAFKNATQGEYQDLPWTLNQLTINLALLETVVGDVIIENNNGDDGYMLTTFFPMLNNVTGNIIIRNSGVAPNCQLRATFSKSNKNKVETLTIGGNLIINSTCASIQAVTFGKKLKVGGDVSITTSGAPYSGTDPSTDTRVIELMEGIEFTNAQSNGITVKEEKVASSKPAMNLLLGTIVPFTSGCITCNQNFVKTYIEQHGTTFNELTLPAAFTNSIVTARLNKCKGHANLWYTGGLPTLKIGKSALDACISTPNPTSAPTTSPTSSHPTSFPSQSPTYTPTASAPSRSPSRSPSFAPTRTPVIAPTRFPMRAIVLTVMDTNSSSGLGAGAIGGIAFAAVALIALAAVGYFYWRRDDAERKDAELVGENFMVNPTFNTVVKGSTLSMPGTLAKGMQGTLLKMESNNNYSAMTPKTTPDKAADQDHYLIPTPSQKGNNNNKKKKKKTKVSAEPTYNDSLPNGCATPNIKSKTTPLKTPKFKKQNPLYSPTPIKERNPTANDVGYLDVDDEYGVYDGATMPGYKDSVDVESEDDTHFGF